MSWISATDPLALVAIQAGQVNTPVTEQAAKGGGNLDTQQRAVQLGEPVPIVFGRRRNGKGGILISPGATETRFENDSSNAITASYHLVLSEGQIDSIAVKDVFQRACRVGSHTQTYNRRAGTWTPGNFITAHAGYETPECPYYCGTVGVYPDMSTLSFQVTIPNGFDQWNRQVHLFIRGGMHVTRLVDGINGASDNFADLVKWMLGSTNRVPAALVDVQGLTGAATFLETNAFTCNCWITESENYADLLSRWAPYFLLGESNNAGKRGLKPLLPVNNNGTIKTTAITPVYNFTENTILPSTLEIQYSSLADRQPFVAQMIWRQQLEDDAGIIRTAEVRFENTATNGPYESHDLSAFCTNENHAVKVGAYILAKRAYTTHTVRFTTRPEKHNTIVNPGDIVRVELQRQTTFANNTAHNYLYQVQRVTKTLAGDLYYECVHFPVDSQGRSLIALAVSNATGSGIELTSNKTGIGCDIHSSTDNTIPAESYLVGTPLDAPTNLNYDVESNPSGSTSNPSDGLDSHLTPIPFQQYGNGGPGTTYIAPVVCPPNTEEHSVWIKRNSDGTYSEEFNNIYYNVLIVGSGDITIANKTIDLIVYCDGAPSYKATGTVGDTSLPATWHTFTWQINSGSGWVNASNETNSTNPSYGYPPSIEMIGYPSNTQWRIVYFASSYGNPAGRLYGITRTPSKIRITAIDGNPLPAPVELTQKEQPVPQF